MNVNRTLSEENQAALVAMPAPVLLSVTQTPMVSFGLTLTWSLPSGIPVDSFVATLRDAEGSAIVDCVVDSATSPGKITIDGFSGFSESSTIEVRLAVIYRGMRGNASNAVVQEGLSA